MNVVLVKINQILMEKFLKLQDVPRTQVYTHTHTQVHIQVPVWTRTGTQRGCTHAFTGNHSYTVMFSQSCVLQSVLVIRLSLQALVLFKLREDVITNQYVY